MELRPYQTHAVQSVFDAWSAGHQNTCLVAATGAGKTQMYLTIGMRVLDECFTNRVLVIAHRQELIDQPLQRISQMSPAWLMGGGWGKPRVGIMMGAENAPDRQMTIATIQTLASIKRRDALLAEGPITHLIVDECHHATASTYLSLWNQLRAVNPQLLHLGVTATPMRADGEGLSRVYSHVADKITIADLVRAGYLVQPRWLAISTNIKISGVSTRNGDFVQSELADRFDTPAGRQVIVQAYQQYAARRRAIAFTASVAGAHDLAAAFNAAGISARAVDGKTPKAERDVIMNAFRRGEYLVLCNCQIATEGFDAPGTSCVLMCRPTRSDGLYIQCMGRGLRPALGMAQPGEDCLILDFIPADSRNIVMAGDVLGLPKEVTRTVLREAKEPGLMQAGFTFDGDTFDSSGTALEIVGRELNYLEQSPHVWHRRDGLMTLGLGASSDGFERILAIQDSVLFALWRRERGEYWSIRRIATDDPYAKAQQWAEQYGTETLAGKGQSWRQHAMSEGQGNFLRRLAGGTLSRREMAQLTKGQAAELITHYQAKEALERVTMAREAGILSEGVQQ